MSCEDLKIPACRHTPKAGAEARSKDYRFEFRISCLGQRPSAGFGSKLRAAQALGTPRAEDLEVSFATLVSAATGKGQLIKSFTSDPGDINF